MDQYTNTDNASKTKNCQEKNIDSKSLKAQATNTETNSEEADDPKSVFSDLTFTVTDAHSKVQDHSASATTGT